MPNLIHHGARFVALLLALCLPCALAHAEVEDRPPPLGLWVFSVPGEPHTHSLSIAAQDGRWRAAIDGANATVEHRHGQITVSGPAEQTFVGQPTDGGDRIAGYWEQGANRYAYSRMVTRVELKRTIPGLWRGEVTAQPRPFTVFLDVFMAEDGGVRAVIRNPERNEILAARFSVEPSGPDSWTLVAGDGRAARRLRLAQTGIEHLVLSHPWFDEPLAMRPATSADSKRYYARSRSGTAQRHIPPAATNDGWSVIANRTSDYDHDLLDELVRALADEDPRSARPRLVHAMLVAHRGRLLFEEYFYDHHRDTRHDTRSLAKVFGPILVGALRHSGTPVRTDERTVSNVLARADEPPNDARKADITLGHLMSFTSGLDCDSATPDSAGSEDNMWSQEDEPDFWRFTARLPLLYEPGTRYAYCSGSINLAGASITAATGEPIYETFHRLIARPLGFGTYHWNLAPNGAGYLAGGVYMRPRDLLKLGAVYLQGGRWQGTRILGEGWVAESTAPRIAITPATSHVPEAAFRRNYLGGEQAYVWRRDVVRSGEDAHASYEATGNGGQILLVVPELELTVVFSGGNYRFGSIWNRWRNDLVGRYVVPALPAPDPR